MALNYTGFNHIFRKYLPISDVKGGNAFKIGRLLFIYYSVVKRLVEAIKPKCSNLL